VLTTTHAEQLTSTPDTCQRCKKGTANPSLASSDLSSLEELVLAAIAWVNRINTHAITLRLNPFAWRPMVQSVRRADAVADWLHNLADFSADDFVGFDEEQFWREFRYVHERHGGTRFSVNYKEIFDLLLSGNWGVSQ
jgi:hypothetical protein